MQQCGAPRLPRGEGLSPRSTPRDSTSSSIYAARVRSFAVHSPRRNSRTSRPPRGPASKPPSRSRAHSSPRRIARLDTPALASGTTLDQSLLDWSCRTTGVVGGAGRRGAGGYGCWRDIEDSALCLEKDGKPRCRTGPLTESPTSYRPMPEARVGDILLEAEDTTRFTEAFTRVQNQVFSAERFRPVHRRVRVPVRRITLRTARTSALPAALTALRRCPLLRPGAVAVRPPRRHVLDRPAVFGRPSPRRSPAPQPEFGGGERRHPHRRPHTKPSGELAGRTSAEGAGFTPRHSMPVGVGAAAATASPLLAPHMRWADSILVPRPHSYRRTTAPNCRSVGRDR